MVLKIPSNKTKTSVFPIISLVSSSPSPPPHLLLLVPALLPPGPPCTEDLPPGHPLGGQRQVIPPQMEQLTNSSLAALVTGRTGLSALWRSSRSGRKRRTSLCSGWSVQSTWRTRSCHGGRLTSLRHTRTSFRPSQVLSPSSTSAPNQPSSPASGCHALCLAEPRCQAWNWNPAYGCNLKQSVVGSRGYEGWTAGLKDSCSGLSHHHCRTVDGQRCVFPFTFAGHRYTGCTSALSENGAPWCAVQTSASGLVLPDEWADCGPGCPGYPGDSLSNVTSGTHHMSTNGCVGVVGGGCQTVAGHRCVFPFTFHGQQHR